MSYAHRRRELGRADRVLPGIWRLRLPLPWPGVPHVNAWALTAGDGIVLVDTGYHEEESLAELERTLALIDRRLEDVRLVVCTHAHSDHYGLAAPIVGARRMRAVDAPAPRAHDARGWRTPSARSSGGSRWRARAACRSSRCAAGPRSGGTRTRASRRVIEPHRELVPGVEVETDHGAWSVH